jgi:poly(3-hydroxybutyrate) depolymerase
MGSFANRAGARDYKLYVPSGFHGQELPLIVMLHGCNQTPDEFGSGTRMNAVAELKPCFVLYPAQAQREWKPLLELVQAATRSATGESRRSSPT